MKYFVQLISMKYRAIFDHGKMAERSKAPCLGNFPRSERAWVRIPLLSSLFFLFFSIFFLRFHQTPLGRQRDSLKYVSCGDGIQKITISNADNHTEYGRFIRINNTNSDQGRYKSLAVL